MLKYFSNDIFGNSNNFDICLKMSCWIPFCGKQYNLYLLWFHIVNNFIYVNYVYLYISWIGSILIVDPSLYVIKYLNYENCSQILQHKEI